MKKKTHIFIAVIILVSVMFFYSRNDYVGGGVLTEAEAKVFVEKTLFAVEDPDTKEYELYFSHHLLGFTEFHESIVTLADNINLKNPKDVQVTKMGKGSFENGWEGYAIIGTFQCEATDHISDFDFSLIWDVEDQRWEILDFSVEEC